MELKRGLLLIPCFYCFQSIFMTYYYIKSLARSLYSEDKTIIPNKRTILENYFANLTMNKDSESHVCSIHITVPFLITTSFSFSTNRLLLLFSATSSVIFSNLNNYLKRIYLLGIFPLREITIQSWSCIFQISVNVPQISYNTYKLNETRNILRSESKPN